MKCRLKKKSYVQGLESQVDTLSKENKKLHQELSMLRKELQELKGGL
jgi:hypothetical protein